jgi:hypothetical protein
MVSCMDGVSCNAWKETVISASATTGALLHEPRQELGGSGPQPSPRSSEQVPGEFRFGFRNQDAMCDPPIPHQKHRCSWTCCQFASPCSLSSLQCQSPDPDVLISDLCTSGRPGRGRIHGTCLSWAALWTWLYPAFSRLGCFSRAECTKRPVWAGYWLLFTCRMYQGPLLAVGLGSVLSHRYSGAARSCNSEIKNKKERQHGRPLDHCNGCCIWTTDRIW